MLVIFSLSGCATPKIAPNDWNTEFVGRGPVQTTVMNQSSSPLVFRVEREGTTFAQVKMIGNGSRNLFLSPGRYGAKMRLGGNCYRAPGFGIPPNAAHITLTLQGADRTNLRPISEAEFAR